MKLTIFQRVLAALGFAVLAACALLLYLYLGDQGRKAALAARLASYQATATALEAAARAPGANDPLLRVPAFPRDPPELDLSTLVLTSAAASGVSVGPVQTSPIGTEKIGSGTYRTVTVSLTITGTLPQILNFFDRVEQGGLRTVVFDNIRLTPEQGRYTAQLEVIAYAQPE